MVGKTFKSFSTKPGATISASFFILIMIGTILLMFPVATIDGKGTSLVDAFFTSTSALCVTGLTVHDTSLYFSRFGHVVIMTLIQLGGLGIMTSYAFFSMAIGKRLLISQEVTMKGVLNTENGEIRKTIFFIIVSALVLEAIGATVLAFHWSHETFDDYIFFSIFHSISAFCNAGFSLFSNSLIGYSNDLVVNVTIGLLIVSGGLGFIVLSNLSGYFLFFLKKDKKEKINLHTKIVLTMTGILIIVGTILYYLFEYNNTLALFSTWDKIFVSIFQSITTRTAGFTMVDISSLAAPTYLYFIFFMFIGGASGSAAGGIKVGTFFLIIAVVYNMFRGREEVEVFDRTIHRRAVQKAVSIATLSLLTILLFCLILLCTEDAPFYAVIFEAFSAFGTVGLSAGLSADLSVIGKVIVSILMFVGRIGPLTLALVIGKEIAERKIRFPEESIDVG
ncbi:MAG: TrkH family potassium uptake protein [Candidatus Scalindua sp.]|nr:TrkH family potassium uptake protein [Candidatus Scalindua sp.]MCR4344190.1 TrkH family potassium uptake protein [Candidatus Scalindua sp.]